MLNRNDYCHYKSLKIVIIGIKKGTSKKNQAKQTSNSSEINVNTLFVDNNKVDGEQISLKIYNNDVITLKITWGLPIIPARLSIENTLKIENIIDIKEPMQVLVKYRDYFDYEVTKPFMVKKVSIDNDRYGNIINFDLQDALTFKYDLLIPTGLKFDPKKASGENKSLAGFIKTQLMGDGKSELIKYFNPIAKINNDVEYTPFVLNNKESMWEQFINLADMHGNIIVHETTNMYIYDGISFKNNIFELSKKSKEPDNFITFSTNVKDNKFNSIFNERYEELNKRPLKITFKCLDENGKHCARVKDTKKLLEKCFDLNKNEYLDYNFSGNNYVVDKSNWSIDTNIKDDDTIDCHLFLQCLKTCGTAEVCLLVPGIASRALGFYNIEYYKNDMGDNTIDNEKSGRYYLYTYEDIIENGYYFQKLSFVRYFKKIDPNQNE